MPSVNFVPNSELQKLDEVKTQLAEASKPDITQVLTGLAGHIRNRWEQAKRGKVVVEQKFLKWKRAKKGEYEPDKLAAIKTMFGNDYVPVYMMLTASKCDTAKAVIKDIIIRPGELSYEIQPTPLPELPAEIEQSIESRIINHIYQMYLNISMTQNIPMDTQTLQAQIQQNMPQIRDFIDKEIKKKARGAAEKMQNKIADQFAEGGWETALNNSIDDLVDYGTGIVRGPVQQKDKVRVAKITNSAWTNEVEERIINRYECRPPWNIYPAPDAVGVDDGYLFDLIHFTPKDLSDLIGVPGFKEDAVREVLQMYRNGGLREWITIREEKARLENRDSISVNESEKIDCLNYWGSAQGRHLIEWGLSEAEIPDPDLEYDICAYTIGHIVIKAMLNPDPLGKKPYSKSGFQEDTDSFWHTGVPEILQYIAGMANAIGRAIVNNTGFACLTGDTIVYRSIGRIENGSEKGYSEITLNELWDKKSQYNSGLRRTKLRCLDEKTGELIANRIVDIIDNGEQDVYEVVTKNGYRIQSTDNHRFMSDGGVWKELKDFCEGDLVAVNGSIVPISKECIDCGTPLKKVFSLRCPSCSGKQKRKPIRYCTDCGTQISRNLSSFRCQSCAAKINSWNVQQVEQASISRDATATTARHRKVCQSNKKSICEICGKDKEERRLEIHHIDKDPWNNISSNLQTLCFDCHHHLHRRHDYLGDPYKHRYVDYDDIISIGYVGVKRVFDLTMESPNHNFIANGFVSHNSGPMIEYDVDRFQGIPQLYPLKTFATTSNQMKEGPAIRFYMPQLVVDKLVALYEFCMKEADEITGFYKESTGMDSGTATGDAMKRNRRATREKQVMYNIDKGIIVPTVERQYYFNLDYEEGIEVFGDVKVVAKGSSSLVAKEQQAIRRTEFLNMVGTNPMYAQILGQKGITTLLEEAAKTLEIPMEDLFKELEVEGLQGLTPQVNPQGTPPATEALNPAGQKMSGQEVTMFQEGK